MPEEAERYQNLAAVAVLRAPDWATPVMRQFAAAHPRPEAQPYYSLYVPDSDEEWEPAASDASGMTDVQRPVASTASDAATFRGQGEQEGGAAAAEVDSAGATGAAAAAAAAAEEDQSADTGVAADGTAAASAAAAAAEGSEDAALPHVRVRDASSSGVGGSSKENATDNSPSARGKRSRKATATAASAAADGVSEDTAVPIAV